MIVAATGHRPNKLGGYSDHVRSALRIVACKYLMEANPSEVISGMALGWDQAVALAACSLGIPVLAAIPFEGQESMWPEGSRHSYHALLRTIETSGRVVIVSQGGYSPSKMQIRNEYMVGRADRIVALWDGSAGGTSNCVEYAIRKSVPIDNLWTRWKNRDQL